MGGEGVAGGRCRVDGPWVGEGQAATAGPPFFDLCGSDARGSGGGGAVPLASRGAGGAVAVASAVGKRPGEGREGPGRPGPPGQGQEGRRGRGGGVAAGASASAPGGGLAGRLPAGEP